MCYPLWQALSHSPMSMRRGATIWDGFSGFLSPDWQRDLSATLGVKVWVHDWTRVRQFTGSGGFTAAISTLSNDSAPGSLESDIQPVPIPQLSARYKWLFVTGGYYAKTRFSFDDSAANTLALVDTDGDGFPDSGAQSNTVFSTSAERYEWEPSAGVYIHPYIAILGGYKKVRQEVDLSIQQESIDLASGASRTDVLRAFNDVDIEGPTIGIAMSVPIGHGLGVYASYAHGFMDTEIRDVLRSINGQDVAFFDQRSPDFDTTYDVAELGFSYTHEMQALAPHMPLSAATVYAGYRYQHISTEFDEPLQDPSDVTKGFAVGVNFVF